MARYRDKSKVYLTINIYSQSLTEDCLYKFSEHLGSSMVLSILLRGLSGKKRV